MSILAMSLYGSRARGDETAHSDTDLMLITTDDVAGHVVEGNLSISSYPLNQVHQLAQTGDLFLYHVLYEGRSLYDPHKHLSSLRSEFQLRSSYHREIEKAGDLGWFIVQFGASLSNSPILSRRVTWVVRTILISKSAEMGRPIFAQRELLQLAPTPETEQLISQKQRSGFDNEGRMILERFLTAFGPARPLPPSADIYSYLERFRDTGNRVALHLVASTEPDRAKIAQHPMYPY
jgi:predicted nucleotidyltransferase